MANFFDVIFKVKFCSFIAFYPKAFSNAVCTSDMDEELAFVQ